MNRSQKVLSLPSAQEHVPHISKDREMVMPNLGDKARGWPTWTRWAFQVIRLLKKGQPSILQRLWLTQPVPRAAPGATNMNVHYCLAQLHCDLEMIFQRKLMEGRLLGTDTHRTEAASQHPQRKHASGTSQTPVRRLNMGLCITSCLSRKRIDSAESHRQCI